MPSFPRLSLNNIKDFDMVVSPKNNGVSGFQSLLYFNFILQKKYRVDTIAQKMGINKDTLYKYIRGERPFPPDRISDLYNTTEDLSYLTFFLDPCGFVPIKPIEDKETSKMLLSLVELIQSAINKKEGE